MGGGNRCFLFVPRLRRVIVHIIKGEEDFSRSDIRPCRLDLPIGLLMLLKDAVKAASEENWRTGLVKYIKYREQYNCYFVIFQGVSQVERAMPFRTACHSQLRFDDPLCAKIVIFTYGGRAFKPVRTSWLLVPLTLPLVDDAWAPKYARPPCGPLSGFSMQLFMSVSRAIWSWPQVTESIVIAEMTRLQESIARCQ